MANGRAALIELMEESTDRDLVRDMLAFAAERPMELAVETATSAPDVATLLEPTAAPLAALRY